MGLFKKRQNVTKSHSETTTPETGAVDLPEPVEPEVEIVAEVSASGRQLPVLNEAKQAQLKRARDIAASHRDAARASKKEMFLHVYRELGTIGAAARAIGVTRQSIYRWADDDEEFRKAWDEAGQDYLEFVEAEMDRRAFEGTEEMVFYQGTPVIDPRTKKPYMKKTFSDTLAMFRAKGLAPEKYRDRVDNRHTMQQAGTVSVVMPDNGRDSHGEQLHDTEQAAIGPPTEDR